MFPALEPEHRDQNFVWQIVCAYLRAHSKLTAGIVDRKERALDSQILYAKWKGEEVVNMAPRSQPATWTGYKGNLTITNDNTGEGPCFTHPPMATL